MIALDAETGAEAWRVDLAVLRGLDYGDFANRGVVVAGDRIYAGTSDARLACLMRADGRPCDGFGVRGQIALDQGLRRPPKWKGEWTLTSPRGGVSRPRHRRLVDRRQQPPRHDVRRGPGLRREDRGAALDVPSAARRLARRRRQHLVAPHRRRGQRPRLSAGRQRQPRLLRRQPPRRQRPRQQRRRAEGGDRRGRLGVPDRPPRRLGLRRRLAAAPLPRTSRPRRRRRIEDRAPVPLRSDHRQAALPHRRAQGAGERRARGAHRGHAAVPVEAGQPRRADRDRSRHLGRDARRT